MGTNLLLARFTAFLSLLGSSMFNLIQPSSPWTQNSCSIECADLVPGRICRVQYRAETQTANRCDINAAGPLIGHSCIPWGVLCLRSRLAASAKFKLQKCRVGSQLQSSRGAVPGVWTFFLVPEGPRTLARCQRAHASAAPG